MSEASCQFCVPSQGRETPIVASDSNPALDVSDELESAAASGEETSRPPAWAQPDSKRAAKMRIEAMAEKTFFVFIMNLLFVPAYAEMMFTALML
jgi:hypothetical protein